MNCLHCGEQFAPYRNTQRLCSPQCYNKWYYVKEKNGVLKKSAEYKMYHNALERSKKSGVKFTIKLEDVVVPDICPVLKVKMTQKTRYAPSLDRIDNSKGYTPDNIRVISRLANVMKRDANEEELRKFGEWAIKTYQL